MGKNKRIKDTETPVRPEHPQRWRIGFITDVPGRPGFIGATDETREVTFIYDAVDGHSQSPRGTGKYIKTEFMKPILAPVGTYVRAKGNDKEHPNWVGQIKRCTSINTEPFGSVYKVEWMFQADLVTPATPHAFKLTSSLGREEFE